PRTGPSLAALLHEALDELLGIGLQDAVDLVEHRVDLLVTGSGIRRDLAEVVLLRALVAATAVLRTDSLLCHELLLRRSCVEPMPPSRSRGPRGHPSRGVPRSGTGRCPGDR